MQADYQTEKTGMKPIGELFRRFQIPQENGRNATEYSDLIADIGKMVKQPYIVVHKRIERAFAGASYSFAMMLLKQWTHEAHKTANPGLTFNWRMKQDKERTAPQPTTV
jgi:hypothetical protein